MAPTETSGEAAARKKHVAIIFGVTGLVGKELAKALLSKPSWKVYGIARKPERSSPQNTNYQFISCDLSNPLDTQGKLSSLGDVTHIFWVTWASQFPLDSDECCKQNEGMLSNALRAILPNAKRLKHVSLQTGAKHYVWLGGPPIGGPKQVYNEGCPRATGGRNFYYVLEDLLREKLAGKVAWSVERPGLITGISERAFFNFMGSLCVYGSICKHFNHPFVFGGLKACWEEPYIDISDARLVAEQHIWAATNDGISSLSGQAFNAINGRNSQSLFSPELSYSKTMADRGPVWREIVAKKGLIETEMKDLANWEFLDTLFRCPLSLSLSREKADGFGFETRFTALESISYWIDTMRDHRLIP
ncbi:hypothetical protein Nepgr_000172 [Nepenthes gracilis]|uniref:PRISE-like Rossmann-fold domain-containing protein n=1 Tax=Nepenthes gracilis TaxID=150966 RepID=A0AAD3P361_NEPGR|nr:hypothetical protein Nepgr_000172 [Nepenthes gracilis]